MNIKPRTGIRNYAKGGVVDPIEEKRRYLSSLVHAEVPDVEDPPSGYNFGPKAISGKMFKTMQQSRSGEGPTYDTSRPSTMT